MEIEKFQASYGSWDGRQKASAAANGKILPFHVVFQGLTSRSLPPLNDGQIVYEESGWHVIFTSNH